MKGIVLAGGTGSRLYPLTKILNKHMLPVYNKPMIYYPLKTLINAGISDIMIVAGKGHCGQFLELFEDGSDYDAHLSYMVQQEPGGIAQALGLCRRFVNSGDGDDIAVILGDNIFEDKFDFSDFHEKDEGARVYLKEVPDSNRFGVAEFKEEEIGFNQFKLSLVGIEEKPKEPKSNYAVTGLYLYNSDVFNIISSLKPSRRGELEISDVNSWYIKKGKMDYRIVEEFWSDAGTFESLFRTNEFIRNRGKENNKLRR